MGDDRPSRLIVSGAVAVVALHTLADTAFAPEPGTSWSDHLVAATASLAVLALFLAACWRARAGVRAAMAIALGILTLEGAALAVADTRSAGHPRGDDWTGFFLGPAGIALCALGLAWLWRSRRRDGRWYVRRGLLAIAAVVAMVWLLIPAGVALLATHRPREAQAAVDLGRPSRNVVVRTADGLRLHGRYVASRNGSAVIVFPGNASRAPQARMLATHGYGVLMLDMRGYGASDGDPNMFGWGGTKDIDAGIAFLDRRPDVDHGRVGGIGFSVGGELMLEAAAKNRALRAVVADGAGERSVRESALRGHRGWLTLPAYAVQTLAVAALSGELPPESLASLTPRIAPTPMFLIGAGRDNGGEDMQPHYFAAAREPKRYWKIPEAGHTGGYAARPGEYTRRVVSFFDASLGVARQERRPRARRASSACASPLPRPPSVDSKRLELVRQAASGRDDGVCNSRVESSERVSRGEQDGAVITRSRIAHVNGSAIVGDGGSCRYDALDGCGNGESAAATAATVAAATPAIRRRSRCSVLRRSTAPVCRRPPPGICTRRMDDAEVDD